MNRMPRVMNAGRGWPLRTAAVAALILLTAVPAWAGGMWVKVAGGISGLAMDDINNGDFRFHDTSIHGYNFPDVDSGLSLSLHLGNDISEKWSFGFSWDRQHAHVSGTDIDVTATLKLDADFFMGHLYWTPVHSGSFSLGAAAGVGFVAANGVARIEQDTVSYGQADTGGTDFAGEVLGTLEFALGGGKGLQVTAGWRLAEIGDVSLDGTTVLKEDGSNLTLDYSGYTLKAGVVWRFGAGTGGQVPDIN